MATKTLRLGQFDLMKGIGILLVILGHCCCPPSYTLTWIYGFHMALFFVVSGYFYKQKPFNKVLSDGYKRIIIPYLYFVLILVIWDLVYLSYKNHSIIEAIRLIISNFNPLNDECRTLYHTIWFLPCMFEVHVFYNLMRIFNIHVRTLLSVICYIIGYFLQVNGINIPFFLDSALSVIIYYHIGQMFKLYNMQEKETHVFIALIILITYSLFILFVSPRVELFMNKFPWYSVFISLPIIYAVYLFCVRLANVEVKNISYKLLTYCGRNSLIIFGVQSVIIEILCMITFKLHVMYTILLFVLAVPLSMLYARFANNHYPFK